MLIQVDNSAARIDIGGEPVDAHDGSLEYFEGRFYWYGTAYGTGDGFGRTNRFVVYSSPDLATWTPHGDILPARPDGMFYRPYVKRCPGTGKYVLWFNWMPAFWESRYGVAVSDRPEGPFTIHTETADLVHGQTGDLGLFIDDDDTPYLIYTSIATDHGVTIEKLAPDLLSSTKETSGILATGDEAPTMFKRNGLYYALFDKTTCFGPTGSGARVYTATSPLGPYTLRGNINRRPDCAPCGDSPIIPAQQAHVARFPTRDGDVYVWVGDRWGSALDGVKGHDHQFWSPPLVFRDDGGIEPLEHVNRWSIELAERT